MKRRVVSMLLMLAMVFSLMPVSATAVEAKGERNDSRGYWQNPAYPDGTVHAVESGGRKTDTFLASPPEYSTDLNQIVAQIRSSLERWDSSVTVHYKTQEGLTLEMMFGIIDAALEETGNPAQGDYLRYSMLGYSFENSTLFDGESFFYDITYSFDLFTTAQQEAELTTEINRVLDSFGFTDATPDYQKIKTIYDYICSNITYDYANLYDPAYGLKYSAYAALIHKTAVCQGYATLFYRMAMASGIETRVITGYSFGDNHAWNIAKLGGKFYNLDSTWDAGTYYYSYFLKSPGNFDNHERRPEFTTEEFAAKYPMWETSFNISQMDACTLNGHKEEMVPGIAATCTETGLTEGKKCAVCDKILTAQEAIPAKGHMEDTVSGKSATCTETGLTEGKKCAVCDTVLKEQEVIPATRHSFLDGKCSQCGAADPDYVKPTEPKPTDPAPTEPQPTVPSDPEAPMLTGVSRVYGKNRYQTSYLAADQLKAYMGVEKFGAIVVASGREFPDALAGSYLANQNRAPILLMHEGSVNDVKAYIDANLAEGGIVYLLGGEKAIPATMEEVLTGYQVKRLAGSNRYKTNLEILKEAGTAGKEILVCTGTSFADSLSASAVNQPILLVGKGLTAEQKEFLKTSSGQFLIIGGEAAVSAELEEALRSYGSVNRVFGKNRYETSVKVAEHFFTTSKAAVLAYAQNFPDGLCGGPLACYLNAPLILTANGRESFAYQYTAQQGIGAGIVLGGSGLISDETVHVIFSNS